MKEKITVFINIFLISFILNLIWENLHAPLYDNYMGGKITELVLLRATLADAAIIVFIFILLALFFRNFLWFQNLNWKSILFLLIIGAFIAIGIEKWALITDRWDYMYSMPIIPVIKVGLTPVLQMMLLPITSFYMLSKIKITKVKNY